MTVSAFRNPLTPYKTTTVSSLPAIQLSNSEGRQLRASYFSFSWVGVQLSSLPVGNKLKTSAEVLKSHLFSKGSSTSQVALQDRFPFLEKLHFQMKRNKINEAIRTTNSISLDEKDYFRSVPIIQALKIRLGPFTSVAILIFFSPNAVTNGSSMTAKLLNYVHVISCISPEINSC